MAKKIVLFLSMLNPHNKEADYQCPNGSWVHVRGDWSNEAPLRYLLKRYSDVTEVISITTDQAKEQTWTRLEELIKEYPGVKLTSVDYGERKLFTDPPVTEVLNCFEKGDKLLMDITGGPRDAVIYLLLLSQALNYMGVKRGSSVYSSFEDKRVENAEPMLGLFELLEGMKEFSSFGRVETLKTYYYALPRAKQDERFERLLRTAQYLSDALSLCRTSVLFMRVTKFKEALSEARQCEDPLLRKLVEVMEEKFSASLDDTGLIRWCMENGMLQQALTIYTEQVPMLIFDKYLDVDMDAALEVLGNAPKTKEVQCMALLMSQIYCMANNQSAWNFINEDQAAYMASFKSYMADHIQEYREDRSTRVKTYCPPNLFLPFVKLLRLRNAMFPAPGCEKRTDWVNRLQTDDRHLSSYKQNPYMDGIATENDFYERFLNMPTSMLIHLLPRDKAFDRRTTSIEHLPQLLENQDIYRIKNPEQTEELKAVLRDYFYIKLLRNLSNHGGVAEEMQLGARDSFIGNYFASHEYSCPLFETPAEVIRAILKRSLNRLDGQQEI